LVVCFRTTGKRCSSAIELLHQVVEILRDAKWWVPLMEDAIDVNRDPIAHEETDFSFLGMSFVVKGDDLEPVGHPDARSSVCD
jgi:hypothetical protein